MAGETDLPLAVFGHSLGATLAFAVIRRLERAGTAEPLVLFASALRAPSRQRPESEYVHVRDDDGVLAELHRSSGTASAILADAELQRLFLPALSSDYRAIEEYRPSPDATIEWPISVLVGDNDPVTSLDDASAWREYITGAFTQLVFPGGHFYLEQLKDELVSVLADTLSPSYFCRWARLRCAA